jgi:FAD-dependent halogenase
MNQPASSAYDLIVVGAGPAGSTLATLVARAGHRVLLLDAQRAPRYQIGESLLPATFNGVFPLLGLDVDPVALGAPTLKRGATFHWGRDESLWTLNFGGAPDDVEPGPEWPTAFNVRREVFDHVLLDHARRCGVEVREGARVTAFDADDERVHGVQVMEEGRAWSATAQWIAGANGQASGLAPLIGTHQPSAFFRNAAVFSYYLGGQRLPPPLEGNVLLESFGDGWVWYIPLSDDLTSVGVVLHHPATEGLRGDREALYRDCLARCKYAGEYLRDARRVADGPYSKLQVRTEFSYTHSRFWKPGALLVGDAACFVDVILSSGVHLAMFGAVQAARAVNTVLAGSLPERLAMNEFELRYRIEYTRFYQGLLGLHDMRHDGATYRAWLRTMLRTTQGVHLADEADAAPNRQRTWQAVGTLRKHNARMLAAGDAPTMEAMQQLPEIAGELTIGADGLHFVALEIAAPPSPIVTTPLYDYGKLHASAAPWLQAVPDGVDGALALVRAARERGRALRVRGSGHTFSGASLPRAGEVLVRTQGLDHYAFEQPGTLRAGAGAVVWDIRDLAREHGYDLPVFNGGWAGPTLGGYLCAGGFGKSGLSETAGGLWENVVRVRLIDGHGELRTIARSDPAFRWLFGGYGQLGLIVDAELTLIPYAERQVAPVYPLGVAGRIPRRQVDDPRVNDEVPGARDAKRLFWFTLLVSPAQEASAWAGLHELVRRFPGELVPDGGWAGPEQDGVPIGYHYVIRFHEFNPPLVYPHAETFYVVGVMSRLHSGDAASNARVREIELAFNAMARERGLRLYLQAENVGGDLDLDAYYGDAVMTRFRALKHEFDPAGLFNGGVVFRVDAPDAL